MISKIVAKLKTPAILYTLSSLIYSFSTYIVMLLIPYKLDLGLMAHFSAALNIVMMLSFIFEFGVVTSYLRYHQLYKTTHYINATMQLIIFVLMIVVCETFLGDLLDHFLGGEKVDLDRRYIYLSAFAILAWVFFKNIFLANKQIRTIFFNALFLTVARVGFLIYILLSPTKLSLDRIYLYLFILPFGGIIFYNLKYVLSTLAQSRHYWKNSVHRHIFLKRFKGVLVFALTTYVISILYVYASRYPIVYLTKESATKLLAELGYAMSFGGMIIVFSVSLRSYLISKFNISNTDEISRYVKTMASYKYRMLFGSLIVSLLFALIVYFIKPAYMSIDTAYFVFILVEAYLLSAYLGMFSLLSKTFNFNNLELKLNLSRLAVVIFWSYALLLSHPILGFLAINASMVLIEFLFAKIVLDRVEKKVGEALI